MANVMGPMGLPTIPLSLDPDMITDAGWITIRDQYRRETVIQPGQGAKGGPGSGFRGHVGRPGKRGGSQREGGLALSTLRLKVTATNPEFAARFYDEDEARRSATEFHKAQKHLDAMDESAPTMTRSQWEAAIDKESPRMARMHSGESIKRPLTSQEAIFLTRERANISDDYLNSGMWPKVSAGDGSTWEQLDWLQDKNWHIQQGERHFELVKAAKDAGVSIPDNVKADYPGLFPDAEDNMTDDDFATKNGVNFDGSVSRLTKANVTLAVRVIPAWARTLIQRYQIAGDPGYEFATPDGQKFRAAGEWNLNAKTVNLFNAAQGIGFISARDMLWHETGHAIFDEVAHNQVWRDVKRIAGRHADWFRVEQDDPDIGDTALTESSWRAHAPEIRKASPLLAGYARWKLAWKAGEDGITDYSRAWHNETETFAAICENYWHPNGGRKYLRGIAAGHQATDLVDAGIEMLDAMTAKGERMVAPTRPVTISGQAVKGGPGSGFRGHIGRPGKRGGSQSGDSQPAPAASKNLESHLDRLRPALAKAAQEEYDAWQPDEDGMDAELGAGGICDRVSQAMAGVLSGKGIDTTDGGQEGDDHAYIIAYNDHEAFAVDIPPSVYERGGGYSWAKRPGVRLGPDHIAIEPVDRDAIDAGEEYQSAVPATHPAYEMTGADLPELYHGGKLVLTKIDPEMLNTRDAGYYGQGFYVSEHPDYAKTYGGRLTRIKVSDDARVLNASLQPSEAPGDLLDKVQSAYTTAHLERAIARGKEPQFRDAVAQMAESPISWKNAVDWYANANKFDVVRYSAGEMVIKNLDVVRILNPKAHAGKKGGPGSGYHEHPGRPGKRGGSLPRGESPGPAAPAKSRAALLRERLATMAETPQQRKVAALQERSDTLEAQVRAFERDNENGGSLYRLPIEEQHRVITEENKVRGEYYKVRDELKGLTDQTLQVYADALKAEHPTPAVPFAGTLPMRRNQTVPGTVTTIMVSVGKARQAVFGDTLKQVLGMVDADRFPKGEALAVNGKAGGPRASYIYGQRTLQMHNGQQKALAHELGHFLEDTIPGLKAKAETFRNERCKGEKIVRMPANEGYGKYERGYRDHFIHQYMGKVYDDHSTEIVSMGVEMLLTNPHKLAREDPPYFDFIVNALQG